MSLYYNSHFWSTVNIDVVNGFDICRPFKLKLFCALVHVLCLISCAGLHVCVMRLDAGEGADRRLHRLLLSRQPHPADEATGSRQIRANNDQNVVSYKLLQCLTLHLNLKIKHYLMCFWRWDMFQMIKPNLSSFI